MSTPDQLPAALLALLADLLRDTVSPLEVSAAVIESDDSAEMAELISRIKAALNAFDKSRLASTEAAAPHEKSLHAQAADLLRPFLKPGDKVIWRGAFRWFDDDGVLSNHYDSQELESLAADFGYQIDWDFNLKHAAIIREATPPNSATC